MAEGPRGDRWTFRDIPHEAYGRVTEPERFLPLHAFAERLIERSEREFDVAREEREQPYADGVAHALTRRSVRLVPSNPGAVSLSVDFTSFPGVFVRVDT